MVPLAILTLVAGVPIAAAGPIIAVKVPVGESLETCAGCLLSELDIHGSAVHEKPLLSTGFSAVRDPAVSPDGRTLLFAGKRQPGDPWQIFRLDRDSGTVSQVTSGPQDSVSPRWAGSLFHLDDQHPAPMIVYVSSVTDGADTLPEPMTALFAAGTDGSEPTRLTFGSLPVSSPEVLSNGRIVFSSWRRGEGKDLHQELLAVNLDGTDLMLFAEGRPRPTIAHAFRVGHSGTAFLIATEGRGLIGDGRLATVLMRRPLKGLVLLGDDGGGRFASPLPLSDGTLVAAHLPGDNSSPARLVRVDPASGEVLAQLHADSAHHLLPAAEWSLSPVPRGRASVVDAKAETGVLYCLSAHTTDRPLLEAAVATASAVRVLAADRWDTEPRQLGTAPLAGDGSFHVEVPARTPLILELLDQSGAIVAREKDAIWVMPGERRGCIGCHEDRELSPPNRLAEAITRPAARIGGPAKGLLPQDARPPAGRQE